MADKQILPTGVQNTPGDYVVPNAQIVTIGAIFAHYNGAGAAGDYVPTVDIISDSGATVLSVVQDVTVAVGSSAEASWAPFLKTAAAAAPPVPSGTIPWFLANGDSGQTLPNFADTVLTWDTAGAAQVAGGTAAWSSNTAILLPMGVWHVGCLVSVIVPDVVAASTIFLMRITFSTPSGLLAHASEHLTSVADGSTDGGTWDQAVSGLVVSNGTSNNGLSVSVFHDLGVDMTTQPQYQMLYGLLLDPTDSGFDPIL